MPSSNASQLQRGRNTRPAAARTNGTVRRSPALRPVRAHATPPASPPTPPAAAAAGPSHRGRISTVVRTILFLVLAAMALGGFGILVKNYRESRQQYVIT